MTHATQADTTKTNTKRAPKHAIKAESKPPEPRAEEQATRFKPIDDEIPDVPTPADDDGLGTPDLDPDEIEIDDPINDENAPIAPAEEIDLHLRALAESGKGAPFRICVRALSRESGLRPVRGYLSVEDVAKHGGLRAAVAALVDHRPGQYVVSFVDPSGRNRVEPDRTIKLDEPPGSDDVRSLEQQIQRTRRMRELAEAKRELEDVERSGKIDPVVAELRAVRRELAALKQTQAEPAAAAQPWWKDLAIAALPIVLKRLLTPPPAPDINTFAPIMQKAVEIGLQTRAADERALREREDRVLDMVMAQARAKAGLPDEPAEEDNSLMGLAGKFLEMFRSQREAAAAPPVQDGPGVVPAAARAPGGPPSPFVRFVAKLLRCFSTKTSPVAAAAALQPIFAQLPQPEKVAITSNDNESLGMMMQQLPPHLYAQLGAAMQAPGALDWYGKILGTLVGQPPAAQAAGPASAPVVDAEIAGGPAPVVGGAP